MRFDQIIDVIFESFSRECLYPGLWNNFILDPVAEKKLSNLADDFIKDHSIPIDAIEDVIITGSMANYNWSDFSDIDLHIIVDYEKVDDNEELVAELFKLAKSKWNNDHKVEICGHEVEIYVQDSTEPHHATGVYSLLDKKWVKSPERQTSDQPHYRTVERKAAKYIQQINDINYSHSPADAARKLMERLKEMRMVGLKIGGEYSIENLVYKHLRNHNHLDKLRNMGLKAYDSKMSLKDCENDEC